MAEEDSVEPGPKRKQQAASTRRLVGGVAATFSGDGGLPPPKKYNTSTNSGNDSVMQSISTRDPGSRSLGQEASMDQSYNQSSHAQSTNQGSTMVLVSSNQIGGGTMNSYFMDHLDRMRGDVEQTTRKLELEQRRLYDIDASLACAQQEYAMKNQRYNVPAKQQKPDTGGDEAKKKEDPKAKTQGASNAAEAREEKARRNRGGGARSVHEVRTLEARLEKKIGELNQGKSENDQLREQINQLRKERQTHDNVFRKLARAIKGNEKRLTDIKQQSSDTKNEAEECEESKISIAKMAEREREEFKAKCLSLKLSMHQQETLQKEQEKLQNSLQLRSETSKEGKDDQVQAAKPKKYVVADEEEAFSKDLMCNRILKTCFLNTIQRRHIRQYQKNVEVFEQAFATIKSSTGISDIEEIVKIFVKLEERNYSLLTYVNTLNRDIESIEMRNKELSNQLKDHQERTGQSVVKKDAALKDLIMQIKKTQSAAEEKEKMVEEAAQALADCRPVILNITKYLQEELPPLLQASWGEGEPPPMRVGTPHEYDENLNNFLMYIEEAVMQFRVCLSHDPNSMHGKIPPKPERGRRTGPTDLPSAHPAGDDSDDEESGMGDRPWTDRQFLKDKVSQAIQRRRKNRVGGGGGRAHSEEKPQHAHAPPAEDGALSKSPTMAQAVKAADGTPDEAKEDGDGDRNQMWWRGQAADKKGKKSSLREPAASG